MDFFFLAVLAAAVADLSLAEGLAAFFPALLHEGGHLLALFCLGQRPGKVHASAFGLALCLPRCLSPGQEFLVLAAGPFVNFLCAFLLSFAAKGLPPPQQKALILPHLALGFWNLLPVFPTDGGRMLRLLLAPFLSEKALALCLRTLLFLVTGGLLALFFAALVRGHCSLFLLLGTAYLLFCSVQA